MYGHGSAAIHPHMDQLRSTIDLSIHDYIGSMSEHRIEEWQLTDIEIRARDQLAPSYGCNCNPCVLARDVLAVLAELRATQRDVESHAKEIARLRLVASRADAVTVFDAVTGLPTGIL